MAVALGCGPYLWPSRHLSLLPSLRRAQTVRFFHSPYLRTRQTLSAILKANFIGQAVQVSSEPRLREQDFGNFQDAANMDAVFADRQRFGRFFYRFPDGEVRPRSHRVAASPTQGSVLAHTGL